MEYSTNTFSGYKMYWKSMVYVCMYMYMYKDATVQDARC